jgi:hypothetical protein
LIGLFTTTDPDDTTGFAYSLVAGTGDTDNSSFTIVGDQLRSNAIFDFETKSSYTILVRTTDIEGSFFNKQFTITVADVNERPAIVVLNGGANVAVNTGIVNFGTTILGNAITRTITISNVGAADLVIGTVAVTGAQYSLVTQPALTIIPPGGSTSIQIIFHATTVGNSITGTVSFTTNDSDESPFNFIITGVVNNPTPAVQIIDDGDAGFSTIGNWISTSGQGRGSDVLYSERGTGADIARWSFSGLTAGQYRVSATWSRQSNRATNSPFRILSSVGGSVLGSALLNQELAPNDFTSDGSSWENIGTVTIIGNTLVVELSDLANEFVIADAIRIERIGDLPT